MGLAYFALIIILSFFAGVSISGGHTGLAAAFIGAATCVLLDCALYYLGKNTVAITEAILRELKKKS